MTVLAVPAHLSYWPGFSFSGCNFSVGWQAELEGCAV